MFVTLEGLSGVGKSTVARLLADALDACWMPTVPIGFGRDRSYFTDTYQLNARFWYFMAAVSLAAPRIRRVLDLGHDVVAESYFARTIAFHRGMGSPLDISVPSYAAVPDATFRLTCGGAERQRRLAGRSKPRTTWDRLAEERADEIEQEYQRFPMHLIDTTAVAPDDVVAQILSHPLDGRCQCANAQCVAGDPDLLSAVRRRFAGT